MVVVFVTWRFPEIIRKALPLETKFAQTRPQPSWGQETWTICHDAEGQFFGALATFRTFTNSRGLGLRFDEGLDHLEHVALLEYALQEL